MKINDASFGIVVVLRKDGEDRFLLLLQKSGVDNWSFPKGHPESGESPKETAMRELLEETGITDVTIIDAPLIREAYTFQKDGNEHNKVNQYFLGFVDDATVVIPANEISKYVWATHDEALTTFTFKHKERIGVLNQAVEYLKQYGK